MIYIAETSRRLQVQHFSMSDHHEVVGPEQKHNSSESEEGFRSLYENSALGIYRTTPDGQILMVNPAAVRMLGYSSAEELTERNLEGEGFEPRYPRAEFRRRIETEGAVTGLESAWIKKDGSVIYVRENARCVRDKHTGAVVYEGTFEDLTERKLAEEALRTSEQLLRGVTENIDTAFFVFELKDGRADARYLSSGFEKIWCRDREAAVRDPRSLIATVHPEDRAILVAVRDRILAGEAGPATELQFRIMRPDGSIRWIRGKSSPIRNSRGVVDKVVGLADDVTEYKSLQEQLFQAQKMECIGRLADGIAHDFNNTLGVILGYSDLVKMRLPDDKRVQSDLLEIQNAVRRASEITRQLRAFSTHEIGEAGPVDINELIAGCRKTVFRLIGKDVDVRFALAKDLWRVKCGPSQIEQVLINLVVNARDAMPEGGILTITTQNCSLDEGSSRQRPGDSVGDHVLLGIADSGIGMDDETLSHAFEPFFTTKDADRGTGLGLATVHAIVKQIGGFIEVSSEPGRGTDFRIYLPRTIEDVESRESSVALASGRGTLLFVEDEPANRDMMVRMLEALDYKVLVAETPTEALVLAKKAGASINLLITDVLVPGMNGYELAQRLQSQTPGLKVLYVSGYSPSTAGSQSLAGGSAHFLQKPFTMQELSTKVRTILAGE